MDPDHPSLYSIIVAAEPEPLGAWAAAHTDRPLDHDTPVCYEGVASTTRARLHAHHRSMYADIEQQLLDCGQVGCEAAHYMERLMAHVYG